MWRTVSGSFRDDCVAALSMGNVTKKRDYSRASAFCVADVRLCGIEACRDAFREKSAAIALSLGRVTKDDVFQVV